MRVGIDTRFYSDNPTGIGTYIYNLCLNMYRYFDIELVLFLNNDSPLIRDSEFKDVEKVFINKDKMDLLSIFTLGKVIDNANLDLFHAPSFIIPFCKTKTIVTIHDLIHINFNEGYNLKYKIYYNLIVKPALKKAEKILTVSESSKKEINKWLGFEKTEVTYLAASNQFSPHIGIIDLFYLHSINKDNFILYVGNNRPNKNIKRLILAYANIKSNNPEFSDLVIICKPDNELKQIIHDNFVVDSVKFIENISNDELIILYSYALFFIFPSIYEGFGLPILEAMSCGCPVTCANISPLKEVAGNAAVFFDPYSIEDICQALDILFKDNELRKKLIYLGRLQSNKFNWKNTALETYNNYKVAISKKIS